MAETFEEAAKAAVERAAYTKLCCLLGAVARTSDEEILRSVTEKLVKALMPAAVSTFAVRGMRIEGARVDRLRLEKVIGAKVLKLKPELKVDLAKPDVTIFFVADLN